MAPLGYGGCRDRQNHEGLSYTGFKGSCASPNMTEAMQNPSVPDPNQTDPQLRLGRTLLAEGRDSEALAPLLDAAHRHHHATWAIIGDIYLRHSEYAQAATAIPCPTTPSTSVQQTICSRYC